jgi:hypothetical protein
MFCAWREIRNVKFSVLSGGDASAAISMFNRYHNAAPRRQVAANLRVGRTHASQPMTKKNYRKILLLGNYRGLGEFFTINQGGGLCLSKGQQGIHEKSGKNLRNMKKTALRLGSDCASLCI